MNRLPKWVLTNKYPAFYDTESASVIEQTAKVYGAMNTLIDEYNAFVDSVNENMATFEAEEIQKFEEFAVGLRQEFQDFIDVVDMKVQEQDQKIAAAENYMMTNIAPITAEIVNQAIANGTIRIAEEYNEATESYNLLVTGGV